MGETSVLECLQVHTRQSKEKETKNSVNNRLINFCCNVQETAVNFLGFLSYVLLFSNMSTIFNIGMNRFSNNSFENELIFRSRLINVNILQSNTDPIPFPTLKI